MSVDLTRMTKIAQIRDILPTFSINRTVPGLVGEPPIFVAQTILEELGMLRGAMVAPRVAYINVDVMYGSNEKAGSGVSQCDEWHKFAQEGTLVKDGLNHSIRTGDYGGIKIVHLVFKDTGVSVPFYLVPDSIVSPS